VLGDLRWRVVWPLAKLGDVPPGNPASVTVLFDGVGTCADSCLSSLFTGDLGEDAQNRMLRANPWLGQVDVIEVSHHGSADQSAALYQRVDASIGLIGVGLGNSYGHPTSRLLDILASVGTVAARTDLDGLVLVAPGEKPGSFVVWKQKPGVGRGG
jgi:competence protein ComEC